MAPVNLLKEQGATAMVAGGMGMRPLAGFQQVGITVYHKGEAATVRQAVQGVIDGSCREFGEQHTCGGHDHGGGCGHHHEPVQREVVDGPVEKDRVVFVSFKVTDPDGTPVDRAEGVGYIHGHGSLCPGLERALEGRKAGDSFELTLEPAEAYGERDDERLVKVAVERLPAGLKAGDVVQAQHPGGGVMPLTVVEIGESEATLDANHPLAGRTLVFGVEVLQVQEATDQDLASLRG